MKDQELEVKFNINSLPALEQRLQFLGARLVQPRVHEVNLRFDTPSGELTRAGRVLRLRQDADVRITYKGPGEIQQGVRARQELEFSVSDFDSARALIQALGYEVMMMYEKYRATYDLGEIHITLDEMPYGSFAEIEGPEPAVILDTARALNLNWEVRVIDSYTMIFERLREALGFEFKDLSFENFKGMAISLEAIGLYQAD